MGTPATGVAQNLLGVIATILPLLVVLIQFTARYYRRRGSVVHKIWRIRVRSEFIVGISIIGAVVLLTLAGALSGEIIRNDVSNPTVESVVFAIEGAFVLIMVTAGVLISDVIESADGNETSNDGSQNIEENNNNEHR